jgi:hypothetical protein
MKNVAVYNNTIFNNKGSAVAFSVDQWVAATGQEKWQNRVAWRFADPMLRRDGSGQLTDPDRLPALPEFDHLPGSTAIGRGIDLRAVFGIEPWRAPATRRKV